MLPNANSKFSIVCPFGLVPAGGSAGQVLIQNSKFLIHNSIQTLHFYTQRCRLQAKVFAEIRIFIKKFVYFLKKS